jgi:hypothetical protein
MPPKQNKSYHIVKQFSVNYKLSQKVSQIIVTIKKNEHNILLENNGTRIRAYYAPKKILGLNFEEIGVTETLSAKNELTEVLLHFIGSRMLMDEGGVKSVRWIPTKIPRKSLIKVIDVLYDNIAEGILNYGTTIIAT